MNARPGTSNCEPAVDSGSTGGSIERAVLEDALGPFVEGIADLGSFEARLANAGSEFGFSESFDPSFVEEIAFRGSIPMGGDFFGRHYLLIKLHFMRSVLLFPDLHIEKSARRRAGRYRLVFDADFDRCVAGIRRQHHQCWLLPPLENALKSLRMRPGKKIFVHTAELYEGERLVAGEIGIAAGAVYTSLSGFYLTSGSGTVQLCALGRALQDSGCAFWDLGMALPYKVDLGAREVPRDVFLEMFRAHREGGMELPREPIPAADLLRARS